MNGGVGLPFSDVFKGGFPAVGVVVEGFRVSYMDADTAGVEVGVNGADGFPRYEGACEGAEGGIVVEPAAGEDECVGVAYVVNGNG